MVADPLRERARSHGAGLALVDRSAGYWVKWLDLDGLAHAWARRFRAEGLCPGERVAVVEPAGVRLSALLHACLRSGAALVPISPRAPAVEVERVLADCRPRLLVREGEVERLPEPAAGAADDACVIYTSGTTGPPKGVRLTLANHVASARGCQRVLAGTDRDRWLLALSPHHIGGLAILFRGVLANQAVVTVAHFEERAVLEAIEATGPTLISVVPTMLTQLLDAGGLKALRSLRAILVGGAPATDQQVRGWAALGLQVCPTYGLTETCSQVALAPPGRAAELGATTAPVCPHASIEIVDGEVVVSGPSISPGYVNGSLGPAPHGGSFRTGDLGRLDGDLLTVTGRRDDSIITGGENVRPEEVEAVLEAHPGVVAAAVAGCPDERWGQVVSAWVVTNGEASEAELIGWCRERLPGFKVPRRWRFVDELPQSEGGKLVRSRLPSD